MLMQLRQASVACENNYKLPRKRGCQKGEFGYNEILFWPVEELSK
jgi:hypothetical protein